MNEIRDKFHQELHDKSKMQIFDLMELIKNNVNTTKELDEVEYKNKKEALVDDVDEEQALYDDVEICYLI